MGYSLESTGWLGRVALAVKELLPLAALAGRLATVAIWPLKLMPIPAGVWATLAMVLRTGAARRRLANLPEAMQGGLIGID
jgi:hypothetical protein